MWTSSLPSPLMVGLVLGLGYVRADLGVNGQTEGSEEGEAGDQEAK